jgi:hypothetical protein
LLAVEIIGVEGTAEDASCGLFELKVFPLIIPLPIKARRNTITPTKAIR